MYRARCKPSFAVKHMDTGRGLLTGHRYQNLLPLISSFHIFCGYSADITWFFPNAEGGKRRLASDATQRGSGVLCSHPA